MDHISRLFEALSSPTRLKILQIISETKRPLHIKAISRQLAIDYATTYRHIQTLRKADLLDVYDVGRSRVLNINHSQHLKQLLQSATDICGKS